MKILNNPKRLLFNSIWLVALFGLSKSTLADETVNFFITDTLYVNSSGEIDYLSSNYLDDFQEQNSSLNAIVSSSAFSPNCESIGEHVIDFVLSDGTLSLDGSLTLSIQDTISPTIITNSNIVLNLDNDGEVDITWDVLNLNSNDNCSYSTSVSPPFLSCDNIGSNMVYFTLTDPSGNAVSDSTSITIVDNIAPVLVINQVIGYLDSNGVATISVNDFDNGSYDNCSEDFIFTISDSIFEVADLGMNTVVVSVTNSSNETSSINAQVEVKDTMPPVINYQNIELFVDSEGELNVTGSAFDQGSFDNSVIYNLSLSKNYFDCDDLGVNSITLTAVDNYNNSSTVEVELTVKDNISPLAIAKNYTLVLDDAGNAVLDPLMFDDGSTDNCHVNLSVSQSNFDCTDIGDHNVFLTVTDNNNNSNTATAVVSVVDNTSPNAQGESLTLFLNDNGVVSLNPEDLDAGSSDNCSAIVNYTASKTLFECSDIGTNIVLFGIEDAHENTSSINVVVEIEDNLAPVVILNDFTAVLDSNGEYYISSEDIDGGSSDNCSENLIFNFSDTLLTNVDLGDNTITVIVSDSNGNSLAIPRFF